MIARSKRTHLLSEFARYCIKLATAASSLQSRDTAAIPDQPRTR
jgi:hypothetical protein